LSRRRRHTRFSRDWSSDVCSSDLNFIGLDELRRVTDYYGLDALRFYLLRAAPFGSDLDWQYDELHKSYLELANVLGNGLNRVLRSEERRVGKERGPRRGLRRAPQK